MVNLVAIYWDEDRGVVSLTENKVLMYVNGDFQGGSTNIPYVELADADFRLLVPPDVGETDLYDESLYEMANWGNVTKLLQHPQFDLEKRLNQPE